MKSVLSAHAITAYLLEAGIRNRDRAPIGDPHASQLLSAIKPSPEGPNSESELKSVADSGNSDDHFGPLG
jgi:hypothetical protein